MRGPALLVLASGGGQVLDLCATVLLARTLGMEAFGALVAARAATGLLDAVLGFRSWEAVLAFVPRLEREGDGRGAVALVTLGVILETGIAVLGAATAALAGGAAGGIRPSLATGAAFLAVVYARHGAENLVELQQAVFRLRDDHVASALQALVAPTLRVIGFVLLARAGTASVLVFAACDSGAAVVSGLAGLVAGRATGRLAFGRGMGALLRVHGPELRRFLAHGWLAGAVKGLGAYGAESILGVVAELGTVGAFGIARKLAGVFGFVLSPALYVVTPWIYRATAAGDAPATRRLVLRISAWSLPPIAALDLLLLVAGDRLVALLAGGPVAGAVAPLVLLCAAFSLQFVFCWARPAALGLGMSAVVASAQALGGGALVLGTLALAPDHGAAGAAVAVAVSYAAQVGMMVTAVLHRLGREAGGAPGTLAPVASGPR